MLGKISSVMIFAMLFFLSANNLTAQMLAPILYKGCLSGEYSEVRGNYDLLVSIYAVKGGETVIWSEGHPNVKIKSGCFEIPLGTRKKNLRNVLRNQDEFYIEVKLIKENLRFPRTAIYSADIERALSINVLSSSDDDTQVAAYTTGPNLPVMDRWICPLVKFGSDSKDFVSISAVNMASQTAEVILTIYKSGGTEAGSYSIDLESKYQKTWILDSDEFDSHFNGYAVISTDVASIYPAGYYFYQEYYKHIYAPDEETLSYHWEDNAIIPLTWHRIEY
ncbi:hypothetical protein ACFLTH_11525 [Bacteroidota bacterium]